MCGSIAVALTAHARYARRQARCRVPRNIRTRGMTTFDKREEGFEKQFAHDEELKFKATARRDRLLGLWAAEKLGLAGADAAAYAKEVVVAQIENHDVFSKIRKDFGAKGVKVTDEEIRRVMVDLMGRAVAEIKAGK